MHPSWEAHQKYLEGLFFSKNGRFQEAHAAYRSAIAISPDRAEFWNGEGFVFCLEAKFPQAVESYNKAVNLNPSLPEAWNGLGYALAALHQYDGALTAFQRAINIKPDFAYSWSGLGMIWNMLGRTSDAFAACKHAAELDPTLAHAWFNMAIALAGTTRCPPAHGDMTPASCLNRAVYIQRKFPQTFPLRVSAPITLAASLHLPLLLISLLDEKSECSEEFSDERLNQAIQEGKTALAVLKALKAHPSLSADERELLSGIVCLLNGDPVMAHSHLEAADTLNDQSPTIQYYLLSSLRSFCESFDKEMAFAIRIARSVKENPVRASPEDIYYAGMILVLTHLEKEAERCLVHAADHAPSLYLRWHLLKKSGEAELLDILQRALFLDNMTETTPLVFRRPDGLWNARKAPQPDPATDNWLADLRLAARIFELGDILIEAANAAANRLSTAPSLPF